MCIAGVADKMFVDDGGERGQFQAAVLNQLLSRRPAPTPRPARRHSVDHACDRGQAGKFCSARRDRTRSTRLPIHFADIGFDGHCTGVGLHSDHCNVDHCHAVGDGDGAKPLPPKGGRVRPK